MYKGIDTVLFFLTITNIIHSIKSAKSSNEFDLKIHISYSTFNMLKIIFYKNINPISTLLETFYYAKCLDKICV